MKSCGHDMSHVVEAADRSYHARELRGHRRIIDVGVHTALIEARDPYREAALRVVHITGEFDSSAVGRFDRESFGGEPTCDRVNIGVASAEAGGEFSRLEPLAKVRRGVIL